MPISINGSGTVTGISVGGLPDGIVDTDMLANNAVTVAKSSGLGTSTRTIGSSTTLSSQANVDYTGFGTITRFDIHFNAVSCNSAADWGVQLGTGGSADTSGYIVGSGFIRSSSNVAEANTGGFFTHGLASASYSNNGIFRCFRIDATQHKWYGRMDIEEYGTANHWFYVNGYRTLSGELDIIRVLPESGTFDAGNLRLVTYSD